MATEPGQDGIPSLKEQLSNFDGTQYRFHLIRLEPSHTPEGVLAKGTLTEYDTAPDQMEVQREFGGGKYALKVLEFGKPGYRKSIQFFIGGVAKLPPHLAGRMKGDEGANNLPQVPGSDPLAKSSLEFAHRREEAAARETAAAHTREMELVRENADLKASLAGFKAEMEALRSLISSKPGEKREELLHEREITALNMRTQQEMVTALQAQLTRQQEMSTAPLRELLKIQEESHRAEKELAAQQQQLGLTFMQSQVEQQRAFYESQAKLQSAAFEDRMRAMQADIERARGDRKPHVLDDLSSLANVLKTLRGVTKEIDGNGEPLSMADRFFGLAEQHGDKIPAILGILGSVLQGQGIPPEAFKMPALPPGAGGGEPGPGAPPNGQPDPAAVQRARAEEMAFLNAIKDAFTRRIDPAVFASHILSTVGTGVAKSIVAQPVDDLIEQIRPAVPELGSVAGAQYIRALHEALGAKLGG